MVIEKVKDAVPVQKPAVAVEQADVGEKKSKWWLWIIIALVIIGVISVVWCLI